MIHRFAGLGLGIALLILSFSALVIGLQKLEKNMGREQRVSARRLGQAFLPAIRKAHRMKDDLALQEVLQAMATVPGVGYAGILDSDKRWMAHSQPSAIGQPFTNRAKEDLSLTLQDANSANWGTLLFSVSDKTLRQILRRIRASAYGAWLITWTLIGGTVWLLTRRQRTLAIEVDEWKTAYHYEKTERERLTQRCDGLMKS